MPAHVPGLLAPLTNLSIESLADFSARGTPAMGLGKQQTGEARRDSYEGGRHRCFRQLYWCGEQVLGGPYPVTAYGQRLLKHHGYQPQKQQQQRRRLRVLFQHRAGAARQLLNVDELVDACNAWQLVPAGPSGALPLRANCSKVALNSLEATLAAAQEADVFVGMHGANLVRWWAGCRSACGRQ